MNDTAPVQKQDLDRLTRIMQAILDEIREWKALEHPQSKRFVVNTDAETRRQ